MKPAEPGRAARTAFDENILEASRALAAREFDRAWPALERAHVLGQASPWLHVRSHWWMLRCGLQERDAREIAGQVVRLALAGPSGWLGRYPRGNTGRARIGLFTPMPISKDVEALLTDAV
jgi:hypothetical protein